MSSFHWDTLYWCFGFGNKTFQRFILLGINEMKLVHGKNLVYFREWQWQMGSSHGLHDIDALVSRKKHFNPPFCWKSMGRTSFVSRMKFLFAANIEKLVVPIRIHCINSLVLEKSISSLCFVGNQQDELRSWKESSFLSWRTHEKWVVPIRIHLSALVSGKNISTYSFLWNQRDECHLW